MSYVVTLDGVVLKNEPMDLLDASVEVYRDSQNPGIFNTFISEVTFWGDGYDILYSYFNSDAVCKTVPITIVQQCEDGLDFKGIIYVDDLEVNLEKCTISCSIEDDSIIGRITRFNETKVPVNGGKSMSSPADGGVSLSDIGALTTTPYYDLSTNTPTLINKRWFKILETTDYVLKYITDGKCNATSSYLSNSAYTYTPDTWSVVLDIKPFVSIPLYYPPSAQFDEYVIKIKISGDIFGDDVIVEETINLPGIDNPLLGNITDRDIGRNLAIALNSSRTFNIDAPSWPDVYVFDRNAVNRGDLPIGVIVPDNINNTGQAYPNGVPIVLIFPWNVQSITCLDFYNKTTGVSFMSSINFTAVSPSPSNLTIQTQFNYGAHNFVFTSGNILKSGPKNASANPLVSPPFEGREELMNVSFNDLSTGVYSLFNLCIIPKRNSDGTYTIQVEPEPETFNISTQIFELEDIKDLLFKRGDTFVFSALQTGLTGSRTNFYLHQGIGFTTDSCSDSSLNATSTFYPANWSDTSYLSDNISDESIYMAEKLPSSTSYPNNTAFYPVKRLGVTATYNMAGQQVPPATITFNNDAETCFSVINHFVARNHVNKTRNGYSLSGRKIPKTNNTFPWWNISGIDTDMKNELSFEYPITTAQLNDIIDNPFGYILCDGRKAWIKKISFSIKTGMTNFELLTE
jgi:hypothetical protein